MSARKVDTPLAAIDVGSNTIHLVVARPTAGTDDLVTLADELELVRLGADVNATGSIGPQRAQRAIEVIAHQVEIARQMGAATLLGIATEGVRAARNGADFIARVRAEAGVDLVLVTGEQEAALTFWGATSGHAVAGRRAVVDLGGGSIELVVGDAAQVAWRISLPLGSGAVHDRLAPSDPPDRAELDRAEQTVEEALRPLDPPLPVSEATACGGTATALSALARTTLDVPDETGPDGCPTLPPLTEERIDALLDVLCALPAAEVTSRYGVEEARAQLLGAGAVILRAALRRLGVAELRVSRRGIREGAILAFARHGATWLEAAARG
jgi:exopolyphosphatase/pppGpp-phosphohydrolase